MSRVYRIALILVVLIVFVTACGKKGEQASGESAASGGQPTATAAPPPAEPSPTETPPVAPQPTDTPSEKESGEAGTVADLFNLSALKANPEELSSEALQSYRIRVEWSIEPKEGSATTATAFSLEGAHTSDPLAEHFIYRSEDMIGTETIHIGDKMWVKSGEQWIEMSSTEFDNQEMFTGLESAVSELSGDARLVGEENLNGVKTRHYSFDETILGTAMSIYSKIKGDVWVAVDGGYAVKYVYTAEDDEAIYRWSWEVYDINAPFTIEPPADAQGARDDVPTMSDAKDLVSFGAMMSYTTAADMNAAIEFYKTEMPSFGWSLDEASSMVTDQFAMLYFTKNGETVSVTFAPDDAGGTAVVIQSGE